MSLNQTAGENFLLSQLSYLLCGPIMLVIVILGTIFNLVSIILLITNILRRKSATHEIVSNLDSSTIHTRNDSVKSPSPLCPKSPTLLRSPSIVKRTFSYRTITRSSPKIYIYFLWLTCCDTLLLISSVFIYSVPMIFDCYSGNYAKLIPFL